MASFRKSSTGWESSYFGGSSKVLYDHPEIYIDKNIDWDNKYADFSPLSYYTREKMIKLFLLLCNQLNLNKQLTREGSVKEVTKWTGFGKEKRYYFAKESVENCLFKIIGNNNELVNLFIEFQRALVNTTFYYIIPPDSDKNSKKDDGDGEDDEDERNSTRKGNPRKEAEESLNESKIRKYTYSTTADGANFNDRYKFLKDQTKFVNMTKSTKSVVYDSQQTIEASHLVRLLDISFDPKADIIPDLRAGKLTPSKIGEVPAGNLHIYHRVEENQTTKPFSICILADESGSMRNELGYYTYQNHLLKVLYKAFSEILPPDKIHIYGHSGDSTPQIRIYNNRYNLDFEKTINNQLSNRFVENYDGPVIESIYEKVREQTDDNILFISISDGMPCGHDYGGYAASEDLKRIIEKCKRDRFVTVGIGLDLNLISSIYNYYTVVRDPKKMVQSVTTLINRVVKTEFQD